MPVAQVQDHVVPDRSREVEHLGTGGHTGSIVGNTVEHSRDHSVPDGDHLLPVAGIGRVAAALDRLRETLRIHHHVVDGVPLCVGRSPIQLQGSSAVAGGVRGPVEYGPRPPLERGPDLDHGGGGTDGRLEVDVVADRTVL